MAIILPSEYYFANKSSNEENLKVLPAFTSSIAFSVVSFIFSSFLFIVVPFVLYSSLRLAFPSAAELRFFTLHCSIEISCGIVTTISLEGCTHRLADVGNRVHTRNDSDEDVRGNACT